MAFFKQSICLLLLLVFMSYSASAQKPDTVLTDTTCAQIDIADVLRKAFNKPPKTDTTSKGSILLVPIIGSNPATGFMLGVGGQYAFRMPGVDTRYSLLSGSVQFTTKSQKLFLLKNRDIVLLLMLLSYF